MEALASFFYFSLYLAEGKIFSFLHHCFFLYISAKSVMQVFRNTFLCGLICFFFLLEIFFVRHIPVAQKFFYVVSPQQQAIDINPMTVTPAKIPY